MSFNTFGGDNYGQVGDNNHQHIHVNTKKDDEPDQIMGLVVIIIAALAFSVWLFFSNFESIHIYLEDFTISAIPLAILSSFILLYKREHTKTEGLKTVGTFFLTLPIFIFAQVNHEMTPTELITLAKDKDIWEFWGSLSDEGKKIACTHFATATMVILAGLVNILSCIQRVVVPKQDNRHEESVGEGEEKTELTPLTKTQSFLNIFRMRNSFIFISALCTLAYLFLNRIIF